MPEPHPITDFATATDPAMPGAKPWKSYLGLVFGRNEIERADYDVYVAELGWTE